MRVKEIMKTVPHLVTCAPSDSVMDAARKMRDHNVGCVLVTDNGHLKGILTDRDIVLSVVSPGKDPRDVRLQDVMHTDVTTGRAEWDLVEASRRMAEKRVRRLPIQSDDGKLEGFLSLADLAPVFQKEMDSLLEIEASPAATPIGH